jgi:ribosomal protein S18 acetylase RimI-like enzyme
VSLLVRYAQETELEAVGELTAAAYGDLVSDGYANLLRDAAARAREAQLLVCIGGAGRLAGTATFVEGPGRWHEIAAPDEAEFRMLAVDRVERGRGAGTALIERMLQLTDALGRRRLVCSSAPEMRAAHRLYERLGFKRAPDRDWSPVDGVTLMVFERELD